jgi:prophage regulatory protein
MDANSSKLRSYAMLQKIHESRILRINAVKGKVGLANSSIYLMIANGSFPKPIKLGIRSVGWLESEIDEWIKTRIHESRVNSDCQR